ncbi:MAG: hypothetical protein PUP91_35975, partial [Rhizonema sp. PD37]|nr:hypothetical protein [Rhizonema sp. PD37]
MLDKTPPLYPLPLRVTLASSLTLRRSPVASVGKAVIRAGLTACFGGDVKHSFTGVGFYVDDKYSGEHDITACI